jgi:hypothetical protein
MIDYEIEGFPLLDSRRARKIEGVRKRGSSLGLPTH